MLSFIHESNFKRAIKNLFLKRQSDVVLLEAHFGLGDNLICIGLIRVIALEHPKTRFYLACLPPYFHSVTWIYQDISNIFPVAVMRGREARQLAGFLNATHQSIGIDNVDIKRFDASFYEQYGVPFDYRWSKSAVPPGPKSDALFEKLNPTREPYLLTCNTESGDAVFNLKINNAQDYKVIEVSPETNNIYDWTKLVQNANEIHSIDTAFLHFVENVLCGRNDKLLYYHLAKKKLKTDFTRRLPWHLVEYDD